jgi:hypothetical protein
MLYNASKTERLVALTLVLLTGSVGCKQGSQTEGSPKSEPSAGPASSATQNAPGQPSAAEAREAAMALPRAEIVQPIVNPKKLTPYTGAVGSVHGVVKVTGDLSPDLPEVLAKMEASCVEARDMFGKVFREGPRRTLADVLVAVTEYQGYLPPQGTDVEVKAKGCAFESRTKALTFGQRLNIHGMDNRPYVPEILGQPMPAQLFVLPTMPTVSIAPHRPGRFKLIDSMRLYNVTELFVLPYSTFDVTALDGEFEITGIPVGPAKINALLPQTGAVVGADVVISEGKAVELKLEIQFDRAAWDKLPKRVPLDEIQAATKNRAVAP